MVLIMADISAIGPKELICFLKLIGLIHPVTVMYLLAVQLLETHGIALNKRLARLIDFYNIPRMSSRKLFCGDFQTVRQ